MIKFNKITLDNGLKLLHYHDSATKMVALNLMYNVGSKNEVPHRTGLAHLMEHLMFTGSKNVLNYDAALQPAGGSSNAWTNSDVTNYYETTPAHNIETALWVESDRLMSLSLSEESVRIQKDVVIEEFKQRYINEPYGDLNHLLLPLAYTQHPYRWPTIGISIDHIKDTTREEIVSFYHNNYSVDNLVMCIAGNITFDSAVRLVEKWFGNILPTSRKCTTLPVEPVQTSSRVITEKRDVPQSLIYRAYHMPSRNDVRYPSCDLLSDILSNGRSSRFHQNILSQTSLLAEVDAAIQGCFEPGLFYVRARLNDGTTFEQADQIIEREIKKLITNGVTGHELNKCLNKFHSAMLFDNMGYKEKATRLCEYEMLGDASLINEEVARYRKTTVDDIVETATLLFNENNSSTLYYARIND